MEPTVYILIFFTFSGNPHDIFKKNHPAWGRGVAVALGGYGRGLELQVK